jgi:transposase
MQSEKITKTRRKYDADFKTEVLKMLANGQTPAYIANALGISENIIYRWKSVNQVGKKNNHLTGDLILKNQQLKNRVRQLETEREILKKALSIFSRAT